MIDFEHVTKVYETQNDENVALEDINIHIDEGEFVFILGHSGAGKSTFLKLIQMEEKPTEGKIYINDQDLTTIKRRKVPYLRRQMGAVFQDFRLIPTPLSAKQYHLTRINVVLKKRLIHEFREDLISIGFELKLCIGPGKFLVERDQFGDVRKNQINDRINALIKFLCEKTRRLYPDIPA